VEVLEKGSVLRYFIMPPEGVETFTKHMKTFQCNSFRVYIYRNIF